jgi:hypothetical protein
MTVKHSLIQWQPPSHARRSPVDSRISPRLRISRGVNSVYEIMRSLTTREKAEFKNLDAAYREAWTRLLLRVGYWQSVNADPNADHLVRQEAWDAVERAEAEYRRCRNRLAEYLLPRVIPAKELANC